MTKKEKSLGGRSGPEYQHAWLEKYGDRMREFQLFMEEEAKEAKRERQKDSSAVEDKRMRVDGPSTKRDENENFENSSISKRKEKHNEGEEEETRVTQTSKESADDVCSSIVECLISSVFERIYGSHAGSNDGEKADKGKLNYFTTSKVQRRIKANVLLP